LTYVGAEVCIINIKIGCVIRTAHFRDKRCFTYITSYVNNFQVQCHGCYL